MAAAAAVAEAVGIGAGSGTLGASLRRLLGGSISSCAGLVWAGTRLVLVRGLQFKANCTALARAADYSNTMEQSGVGSEKEERRRRGRKWARIVVVVVC